VRIVIALGGNALLERGQPLTADNQRKSASVAAEALAPLARSHQLIITHGNGPQVGLLALQSAAFPDIPSYPLDVLGAESEGMIGYIIEQEFDRILEDNPPVVTLLTQIEVDSDDPAFHNPTKFIGPVYNRDEAEHLARERGWTVKPDGDKWRRVVPSPLPQRIPDLKVIDFLLTKGVVVICAGGGGIPVVNHHGRIVGTEAVIDKDRASATLAVSLRADLYVMVTDVSNVYLDYGLPTQRAVLRASPASLEALDFQAGSMGPKIESACAFARATNKPAAIGSIHDARSVVEGKAGTTISMGVQGMQTDREILSSHS
jgi:carbamate kinase